MRTSEAFEVELGGRAASLALPRDAMQPDEADLLDADEAATLIRLDGDATRFEARLTPRRPRFTAQVEVEARVAREVLEERYSVQCRPESSRLDRVVVWLSRQREEPLSWAVVDDDAARLSSRRWTANEQMAAGLPAEGETWELRLNPPATVPLTLSARRKSAFDGEAIPSLASAPDADTQTGLLAIHAGPGTAIQVDNRRLSQAPAEPVAHDGFTTMLGLYRYDPWREVGRSGEPPVAITERSAENGALAVIWRATLESRFDSAGMGAHVAEFLVENLGLDAIRVRLPAESRGDGPIEVWVDQQRVAGHGRYRAAGATAPVRSADGWSPAGMEDSLHVALPVGKRYPTVSIAFTSRESRLATVGSLDAPWPELNVAVLSRSWSVRLPAGYATHGHEACGSPSACNWSRRLLGPLNRAAGREVFNPFAAGHWRGLFGMAEPGADGSTSHANQRRQAFDIPASPDGPAALPAPADAQTIGAGGPWAPSALLHRDPSGPVGWQVTSLEDGQEAAAVRYYHDRSLRLAGAIAFLLTISGGWWLARNRAVALLGAACCAGLFALWAPEPYVFAATGVVLGSLFCLTFRLVHRREPQRPPKRRRREEIASPPSTISVAIPWSLVLCAAAFVPSWETAARGEDAASESMAPMYRVIIPVDGQKNPVGGKYYLPERLFAELHRLAATQRELPQGWLLGKAVYRGELVREPVGEQFQVEQIRAQFDLHVFSPTTRVQVPLERTGANLLPDGVSLDGQAIQVEWSEDNRALVFEVAEPGQYSLEMRMRPQMRSESPDGFDLSIPATPMAQLELTLPSAAPTVEVPTARGDVRRMDGPPRFVAELGPSDQIAVRWQTGSAAAGGGPAIDVEELLWMKVQPGSVLIEAKWKLAVVEGRVPRFRLATDPRMRLLPLEGSRSPTVRTSVGDNELLQLELEWPEPLQDKTVVTARFLLTGTSGVGNLRMPQVDILDGRITRRWMAVSVADALQFEQSGGGQLAPVPFPEFLSAWGETEHVPSFAYRLPPGTPDWALSPRPRESTMSVTSSLTLRFAENATEVEYDAKLNANTGYRFHHGIAGPKN
ncbi:MAG: hypothetical protein U1E05_20425, partial [Patescibacteria group bacterium]|nr:hypothetical protein [Patescibacteria group bacterium]